MRIRVRHLTDYRYSAPVRLGTQRLRLLPRGDGVEVIEARILINPEPCARQESIDPHGNRVVDAAFDAETDRFVVERPSWRRHRRRPCRSCRGIRRH